MPDIVTGFIKIHLTTGAENGIVTTVNDMSSTRDRLHTVKSAAEFLALSEAGIRKYLHLGILRRVKVGRRTLIWESELQTLIHYPEEKGTKCK